jgi:hypothetical protein
MRTVGRRKPPPIVFHGSGELLAAGARWNDEMQKFPGGGRGFIPKGVYRFRTHEEANRHWEDCLAVHMARLAQERRS